MFENRGRGIGEKRIGQRSPDRRLPATERRVAIEVGYDLEGIVTDGLAGEIIRDG